MMATDQIIIVYKDTTVQLEGKDLTKKQVEELEAIIMIGNEEMNKKMVKDKESGDAN